MKLSTVLLLASSTLAARDKLPHREHFMKCVREQIKKREHDPERVERLLQGLE